MYIEKISTKEQWIEFREQIIAYVKTLDRDLSFQGLNEEIAQLDTKFVEAFICRTDEGEAKGCVAYKDLGQGCCELKRFFVMPDFRRQGAGEALLNVAVNAARAQGFEWMYLDTLKALQSALRLYLRKGFKEIAPYYHNPMSDVVYLGLRLRAQKTETQKVRLGKQLNFCLEADKAKKIVRQTYLSDGSRKENDAEHAWHMTLMALILGEHANDANLDLLRVISLLIIHDLVEIYAGDTYAYDKSALSSQREREVAAANRLFALLPADQGAQMRSLWDEFEAWQTKEACFAHTLDNFQPVMLNAATDGRAWLEHQVRLSQVLGRNRRTAEGSTVLWQYACENFIRPQVSKGHLKED
ncbi:MAG: GNAT family N-acetyltransferase [Succinivibrio sp.]|nr:GNAT family N-acetyltransferase [Succinivibrio sp.]